MIGGSGKIGMRVMEVLEKSGYQIIDFDLVPPMKGGYEFIRGDITNYKGVEEAIKGVDVVIHLAAYPYEEKIPSYLEGWNVNCTGTFNVFESSVKNKVERPVFASKS